jgi:enamine deaminase RidA (YjgF/YER057c/UK114 family)
MFKSFIMSYTEKIRLLNIKIPLSNPAAANYVPFKISGNLLYIAGQTARENGLMKYTGKAGLDYDIQTGIKASRLCGLNILSQVSNALNGNFDRVISCVSLTVFVQSANSFYDQALIANGVSDLITDIFGETGKATRVAVGVNTLPSNSAVEVAGIFEIK